MKASLIDTKIKNFAHYVIRENPVETPMRFNDNKIIVFCDRFAQAKVKAEKNILTLNILIMKEMFYKTELSYIIFSQD